MEVRYDKWTAFNGEFGHIFYKQPFSYYLVAAEYRFVGNQVTGAGPALAWALRNNGIMVMGQTAESMGLNQDFPISLEVQLLGGPVAASSTGNPLHARHQRVLRRFADHTPLHQLHVQDVRRRPVGPRAKRWCSVIRSSSTL